MKIMQVGNSVRKMMLDELDNERVRATFWNENELIHVVDMNRHVSLCNKFMDVGEYYAKHGIINCKFLNLAA